ncbi:MAG: protein phosphatase 1 regulatory subunit 42 [Oscillospiraceae bacterium]|nr:protein phosphatase 1 regulatory subunit 42 [Oscillospiraceae bacterium]
MKKLLSLIVTLFLCLVMFPADTLAEGSNIIPNDSSGIPDKMLYQEILAHLGKGKNKTFTKKEASGLNELYIGNYIKAGKTKKDRADIKSLKGINNLPNLKNIYAPDNSIADLTGIEKLTKLELLDFSRNKITSFSGLEKLTNLIDLKLSGNQLTDIRGIESLKKLYGLYVSENRLTSVSGIENLTNLEFLAISLNKLRQLPDLTKLDGIEPQNFSCIFNNLPKGEAKKLPPEVSTDTVWVNKQFKYQNVKRKLTLKASAKKPTAKTKTITGKAHKNVSVRLMSGKKTIKTAKTNSKGNFKLSKLNLKKFRGKKLKVQAFYNKDGVNWVSKTVTSKKVRKG